MSTVLITGANRGLGLEFVRQYAAGGWRVHACCRNPAKATRLKKLTGEIVIHRLDVRRQDQLEALKKALAGEPIDILINNAGISDWDDPSLKRVSDKTWLELFHVNSMAPLRVAGALADNVAKSEKRIVAFITSQLGSIAHTGTDAIPYRMSKAALNAGARGLSLDLEARGIICAILSPGWVKTDMGGPEAPLKPATSIRGLRAVMAKLKPADNGRFIDYRGKKVPW